MKENEVPKFKNRRMSIYPHSCLTLRRTPGDAPFPYDLAYVFQSSSRDSRFEKCYLCSFCLSIARAKRGRKQTENDTFFVLSVAHGMDEEEVPTLAEIHVAASHLRSLSLPVTPVLTSSSLNALTGRQIYLKCENFQRTGSFKSRGALNAVLNAIKIEPNIKGFVTHSSGNHGQALSFAASIVKRPCIVVVPRGTPKNKTDAIEHYGAELVVCEATPASRTSTCLRISHERDYMIIPPYDHRDVIAGQ